MLTHSNYIQVFNGKNFNSQDIIVNEEFFVKSKKSLDKSKSKSNTLSKRKLFIDIKEDDTFDIINFFKEVIEQKEKQVGLYKFCKVSDVLNELNINCPTSRTLYECIEDAKKYNTKKEWIKKSNTIYHYVKDKKWLTECTKHFVDSYARKRTKQECIENARKYNNHKEWVKNDSKFVVYAGKYNWMDECSAHFDKLWQQNPRTKEECIQDAKKYKTSKEWRENSPKIFGYAQSKKWLKECGSHFVILRKNLNLSKEDCIENARKYNNFTEWSKNDSAICEYSLKKKWYKECKAHFIKKKRTYNNSRTKEQCIEDAKKYKTRKEWIEKSKTIFYYAKDNNWIKECSEHFEKHII
jgi:hypothetical protein